MSKANLISCAIIIIISIVFCLIGTPSIIMLIIGIILGYTYPELVTFITKKCLKK